MGMTYVLNPRIDPVCNLYIVSRGFGLVLAQTICLSFNPGNGPGNTCTLALENLTIVMRITPP